MNSTRRDQTLVRTPSYEQVAGGELCASLTLCFDDEEVPTKRVTEVRESFADWGRERSFDAVCYIDVLRQNGEPIRRLPYASAPTSFAYVVVLEVRTNGANKSVFETAVGQLVEGLFQRFRRLRRLDQKQWATDVTCCWRN